MTRGAVEKRWKPDQFGESADSLLTSVNRLDRELDAVAAGVLTPEQRQELRQAIDARQKDLPPSDELQVARTLSFTAKHGTKEAPRSSSLFALLNLDPLSGLDPATQEIARSRAFAERALYVAQRMPTLLRWQMELLALDAQDGPAVRQMVASAAQVSASADRLARVSEQLPDRLSKEREAIIAALREQEKEVAAVLSGGTKMSDSLRETLKAFDEVLKRMGVGDPAKPDKPASEPFRIKDYAETAVRLEATSKQLTELVRTVDETLKSADATKLGAQLTPVLQRAESGGREMVDYALGRALILVGVVFAAALLYRVLAPRLTRK